jgi:hypothetical protein
MQWASRVVFGGRVFMRCCSDALSHVHPGYHVSVSSHMRDDLRWWLQSAAANNGVVSLAPSRVTHYVFLDACLSPVPCIGVFSAGAFLSLDADQLQALGFDPPADRENINLWERFAVLVTMMCFGDCWQRSRVMVFSDNAATVSWVSKGAPRPPAARALVCRLFDLCLRSQVCLCFSHVAGMQNVLADTLSRRQWSQFGAAASAALSVNSPFLRDVLSPHPPLQASP